MYKERPGLTLSEGGNQRGRVEEDRTKKDEILLINFFGLFKVTTDELERPERTTEDAEDNSSFVSL